MTISAEPTLSPVRPGSAELDALFPGPEKVALF